MEPTERAHHLWFKKPRPIYWEHLFFGQDSPIKKYFEAEGQFEKSISEYIFNLEVDVIDSWLGFSKAVTKPANLKISDEHYYSFGCLLAYCFFFGIKDLHKFNLIPQENHLQVIDAEVVLTNLILPHETLLLPFKEISFDLCGLSLLTESIQSLTEEHKRFVFEGYLKMSSLIYKYQSEILETTKSQNLENPIRVILRNTREYRSHLLGDKKINDLLAEETEQISRGDIPYFFKYLNDQNLYWISEENGKHSQVKSFGQFDKDIARHGTKIIDLVSSQEHVEKKMTQGIFILQKHLGFTSDFETQWLGGVLKFSAHDLQNSFTKNTFLKNMTR